MKVYILNISITEEYTCATIYSQDIVFASRELAEEYISLAPITHMSGECFNYSIQELDVLTTFDREVLVKEAKEAADLANGSWVDYSDHEYESYSEDDWEQTMDYLSDSE
jgi:hypothetical protein